jgi:ribosomal protein L31
MINKKNLMKNNRNFRLKKILDSVKNSKNPLEILANRLLTIQDIFLEDNRRGMLCDMCKRSDATKLSICSACHMAYYCSKDCQRRHWSIHKKKCLFSKKYKLV